MSERDGKKPVLERIKNSIFRGDDFDTFVVSTFEDKVMPAIGDALEDLACCTIRAIFNDDDYYDDRKRRDRKRNKSGRKDYTQYSDKKSVEETWMMTMMTVQGLFRQILVQEPLMKCYSRIVMRRMTPLDICARNARKMGRLLLPISIRT